jgi:hypothetical protein
VPAFEPGRLRGLGLAGDGSSAEMNTLAPAWTAQGVAPVVLPVYYHWEFSTGPAGDFEYLARRLRTPKKWKNDPAMGPLLANIGTSPMAVDRIVGGDLTTMEGALVPLSYKPGAAPTNTHADSLRAIVNTPASQSTTGAGRGRRQRAASRSSRRCGATGTPEAQRHVVEQPQH